MCGIAGIRSGGSPASPRDLLLAMAGELRHRGPDGTGLFLDEELGMVATRLAIVDLEGGDQPLPSEDRRYWVVQNGEIYNYVELREELVSLGRRFATTSDTEVIAQAYLQWGEGCLERLNGDFAFAIWDTLSRELFLARDRFGVRPLFVAEVDGDFCFASEVKALLRHPGARRELDAASLVELFTTWGNPSGRSAFAGVRELEPGCCLRVTRDGVRERRWWDLSFAPSDEKRADEDWIDELRALLDDSTRIRLRADVPVSLYMSGGLDSTLMTALSRRHAGERLSLFGVGFEDDLFDESVYQDIAADAFNGSLSRTMIGDEEIASLLPRVVELAERPMLRTAPAPLLRLAQTVHEAGVKVVMTGEGADELFGGYDIFREDKVRRFCARDPESAWRPMLYTRLNEYLRTDLTRVAAFLGRFYGRGLTETGDPLYSHRIRFLNTGRVTQILAPDLRDRAGAQTLEPLERRLPEEFGSFTPLGRAQYLEIVTFLEGYLLHSQADRMLMGHSVEGRFPYLDHRVAELAVRLPDRLRVLGLGEKYALRRLARNLVPPEILNRKKRPYRAPIASALIADAALLDVLAPEPVAAAGLLDGAAIASLLAKARARGGDGLSETDEMALVGATTTMLLHERMVAAPSFASAAIPAKVVDLARGDVLPSPHRAAVAP